MEWKIIACDVDESCPICLPRHRILVTLADQVSAPTNTVYRFLSFFYERERMFGKKWAEY